MREIIDPMSGEIILESGKALTVPVARRVVAIFRPREKDWVQYYNGECWQGGIVRERRGKTLTVWNFEETTEIPLDYLVTVDIRARHVTERG